jgi:hypothetical protein
MCAPWVSLAACAGALVVPAVAAAVVNLTAYRVRIGDHPAYVRAVVDFTDGTLKSSEIEATDPSPADGTAGVRVSHPWVQAQASSRSASGISVRVAQGVSRLSVDIRAPRGRFKYISYSVVTGDRLGIDLWKSAPPSKGAEIRRGIGGCLTLDSWQVRRGFVNAAGHEHNLFEHQFQLVVRGSDGRVLGRRSVTAARGGWSSSVHYHASRRQDGTLEAVDLSPKDGALVCLAQTRVSLPAFGAGG